MAAECRWSLVSYVAYTVIHFVLRECTLGVIDMLTQYRQYGAYKQDECSYGISHVEVLGFLK